ncbi:MAG: Flp family type IVb pilin [Pseudomonadota bacterium]
MVEKFLKDEAGATGIEYGLLASLVFLAAVGAVQAFAGSAIDMLSSNSIAVTDATNNVAGGDND